MVLDFRALKARMKPEFHANFEKYYPAKSLASVGFKRKVCKNCGRGFWSAAERDVCDEPVCSGGYRFIGEKLTRKRFAYKEAWDEYVKVFGKWGYVPIERYPVVCRWYEDLYFVNAGVNDFQPYVISGEVEPPAPAVLEPQFCLRFQDIDSVGITGRHYSGFIMVGQHTFNTAKRHVFFKDEGILQIHEFLTKGLGIKAEEVVYHEDVWAGGGNFGPSMEFFCRGLELGNQVYMQYKVLPDGTSQELKTRVIDMGAGLERWSWFSQGNPMSYDSTFPQVMKHLYKVSGVKPDEKLMLKFGNYAGLLSIDDVDDINSVWGRISKELGIDMAKLKDEVYRMRALYAIADHTRSLLVAIHDGALPSNVGGGYNLRTLLRRCWSLNDEFGLDIEVEKVFEEHIGEFGKWYTDLKETGSLFDIVAVERERYKENQAKGRKLIEKEKDMTVAKMVELYDSHGIAPDVMQKITGIQIPDDFYKKVEERHEKQVKTDEVKEEKDLTGIPLTKLLYYEDSEKLDFEAELLSMSGGLGGDEGHVILDKTLFYPGGGGQETDKGHLQIGSNRYDVVSVEKKKGGIIAHKINNFSRLWGDDSRVDDKVKGYVDKRRRLQLVQHHTATHIVNASARTVLGPHIWQAGAHKSEKFSRLDITHYKAVSQEELKKIEERANEIVREAHPVEINWMRRNDAEGKYGMRLYQGGAVPGTKLRIVSIPGIDTEACGGTHLKNTKEAGRIKLLSAKRIQDGVVRLEFTAGEASEREIREDAEKFILVKIHLDEFLQQQIRIQKKLQRDLEPFMQMQRRMAEIMGPAMQMQKRLAESLEPVERMQEQLRQNLEPLETSFKIIAEKVAPQMEESARIFSVPKEKLGETINRFTTEINQMEEKIMGLGGEPPSDIDLDDTPALGISGTSRYLFDRWKEDRKILEKLQAEASGDLVSDIEAKFTESNVVKHVTSGLMVKALTEAANAAVSKPGRLLILVNMAGDKVNVVVASSGKANAGDVCKRLCALLGGGGGGKQALAMGGGNAKDAERILEELNY
ncbi:MAG: alanine--tRNA ligase [Candidatus Altiarchaeota archaeon]